MRSTLGSNSGIGIDLVAALYFGKAFGDLMDQCLVCKGTSTIYWRQEMMWGKDRKGG